MTSKIPNLATASVTSKDGTRIVYDKLGEGPPLVIVNGALSVRTFSFAQNMADELARHFTVYNYDRRGRNDSGDTQPYDVQKEVDDLAAVCGAAGGKPLVFGQSSGAALALEAAARGLPMAALFAYEPPYTGVDPGDTTGKTFQTDLDRFIAQGDRDGAVRYFMRTVGMPGFAVTIMKLMPMWKTMRGVAHTLPYDARVMNGFEVPAQRLASIRLANVTVANGEKTAPKLKAAAAAAAKAVPGARHVVVAKSNHGVKPQRIAPVLVTAFKGSASATG